MDKNQAKKILEEAALNEGMSTEDYTAHIMEAMTQARSEATDSQEASALWAQLGEAPTPEDLIVFLIASLSASQLS